jgi:protein PhnA
MDVLPKCPECSSVYTYEGGDTLICPECAHEWVPGDTGAGGEDARTVIDSNGNTLQDGDTVTVI